MQYDLKGLVIKTGIGEEKLQKEIEVMQALQDLFMTLGNSNQKVALFGGTALNKIYYGERQRLSYDIDVESYSFENTKKVLAKVCNRTVESPKAARFVYKNVVVDLMKAHNIEEPELKKAYSLLSMFDYPIASVTVPSYSLEYLLAKKTMAVLSRTLNKDIYDMWVGMQLLQDKDRYVGYSMRLAKLEKVNIEFLIGVMLHHIKSDSIHDKDTEIIDTLKRTQTTQLANDVALWLKRAFINHSR